MAECNHYWAPSNTDENGNAIFRPYMGVMITHATCKQCNCRTLFTKEQWSSIPAIEPPK